MNRLDIDNLTGRITSTFPRTPPAREWARVLEPLNVTTAHATLDRLIDETDSQHLTIKAFRDAYTITERPFEPSIPQPDDTGPIVSFDDYYTAMLARINAGDRLAVEEQAAWERNRNER